jgi:RimJ/RimL family protein N-acetyltransferase
MTPKQDITLSSISKEDNEMLANVERLAKDIWTAHYSPIIGMDQVNYMLDKFQSTLAMKAQLDEGYRYYSVVYAGELIGYYAVQPRENNLFLSKVYLLNTHRGKGIFSLILTDIERIARGLNKSIIELTVNKYNEGSIAVYKSKGFDVVAEAVFDIGKGYVMDDYILRKHI